MSRMRNGHGSKCMCGKGHKIVLGPSNRKLLEKGGMRILRLSPEEIAENKARMTDLMKGARGSKPKNVEGSGKVLHDWKDLFGGTIKRDAIDEIEDGDKRKAIDLVEMLRRPEQAVRGGTKTRINRALKSVVDTADKELSEMGRGSKRAAGFTKKKFKDVLHGVISGMGVKDMEEAMSEMEGGKVSLKRENWGIGRTGRDLSTAWSKIMSGVAGGKKMSGGVLTRRQRQAQEKDAAAAKANADKAAKLVSVTLVPAAQRRAAPQKKTANAPVAARTRSGARRKQQPPARREEAPIDFGEDDDEIEQAVRAGSRIKDPLAWSTTKVPNKCGSEAQRAEARRAAQTLQRCPANDERRDVRSDKIKQWEASIRADERDKLEGRGLYAGFPHGSGFIQPTGGAIYGGSIGARIARPTNVGAGGNLLSPFAASKRPQAGFANFHMLQQMPVVYQPPGMFSSK